jgi:hypothetical protein
LTLYLRFSYVLLFASIIGAFLAMIYGIFIFKIATAAVGIAVLLILIISRSVSNRSFHWLIIAYGFSVAGDYFLSFMNGEESMFISGILLYFLAHISYLAFTWSQSRLNWKFTTFLTILFLVFYYTTLYPAISEMPLQIAVLLYLLISCLSLGVAVSYRAHPSVRNPFAIGIGFILLSDTLISLKEFLGYAQLELPILLTYYLAHSLITWSVIKTASIEIARSKLSPLTR